MPPIGQATRELQPVYTQAQNAIQGQTPAIQQLYTSLVQGLQGQVGMQTQNVVDAAARAGVSRTGLAGDVNTMLGQELALQTGQLGVQQAQAMAANQQLVGKLGVDRAGSINTLAQSIQGTRQEEKKAKMEQTNIDRQYKLDSQKATRDFEIAKTAEQRRQAEAASKASSSGLSQEDILSGLYSGIKDPKNKILGSDGKMSPNTWNTMLDAWRREGGSVGSFVANFKDFVNYEHQDEGRNDLTRYAGVDTWND